jgi:hypothetical protein
MTKIKKLLLAVVILLIGIQFIQPARNWALTDNQNELSVPFEIKNVLQKACYDCHSNYVKYPWYSYVQPVGWWMKHHVDEGRDELNFSEFNDYSLKRKLHKLEEIVEQVEEGEMPMQSYTIMHATAKLDDAQKKMLIEWAKNFRKALSGK